jgi:hypothetical protein
MKTCIYCGEKNSDGSVYCTFCDNELNQTLTVNPLLAAPEQPQLPASHNGPGITLMIPTQEGVQPVTLPYGERIVLGRLDHESEGTLYINLSRFEALELGVSRVHAVINNRRQASTLSDLESTNGSYLNGRKLRPHQPYLLHAGDEIRLARMVMYVQ